MFGKDFSDEVTFGLRPEKQEDADSAKALIMYTPGTSAVALEQIELSWSEQQKEVTVWLGSSAHEENCTR